MIRRALLIAALAVVAAPVAAQRSRDDNTPSRTDRDHYGPLARYELLTERVDRKNARAHAYERESAGVREWKRRQRIDDPMDDDNGED